MVFELFGISCLVSCIYNMSHFLPEETNNHFQSRSHIFLYPYNFPHPFTLGETNIR